MYENLEGGYTSYKFSLDTVGMLIAVVKGILNPSGTPSFHPIGFRCHNPLGVFQYSCTQFRLGVLSETSQRFSGFLQNNKHNYRRRKHCRCSQRNLPIEHKQKYTGDRRHQESVDDLIQDKHDIHFYKTQICRQTG